MTFGLRRALAGALVVAGAVSGLGGSATAAEGVTLVPEALGGLSPALVGVHVTGGPYESAHLRWATAGAQLAQARSDLENAAAIRLAAEAEAVRREDERIVRQREHVAATEALEAARVELVGIAVANFMEGNQPPASFFDPGSEDAEARAQVMAELTTNHTVGAFNAATAAEVDAARTEAVATEAAAAAARARDEAVHLAERAVTRQEVWQRERVAAAGELVRTAPQARVAGSDLAVVTLDAYVRAAARVEGCGIGWSLLAGIGRVESRHGTYRGASVDDGGDVVPRIIGIRLDGTNNTMVIGDSDGGAYDGDPTIDRAVGPMQFIPTTWRTAGVDGNGDGRSDPHNLYDAAAAAAGYLCRASGGMDGVPDMDRAVFSYNHDSAYVARVVGLAGEYARLQWAASP
jgi:membrane-bound lytic murein transglycosylase B